MTSLPPTTPVTDGGGIVRHVPSCAIALLLVPTFIAHTGTSALILIAISASGLVLTNVTATTATGNHATGLRCAAVARLPWRAGIGAALIVAGYLALLLIPLVLASDFEPQLKAALSAIIGFTPLLTKLAAVALLGKPALDLIKRVVARFRGG